MPDNMADAFYKVAPRTLLSKVVEEQLEKAIKTKKLLPGQKLPTEFELCELFGVSRTAMREALRMLSARGLVTVHKGKGIFVKNFTSAMATDPLHLYLELHHQEEYVLDIVHARQIIEPPVAALAAIHYTGEDAERIIRVHELYKNYEGDFMELAKLDMGFHLEIAKAAGNSIIPLLLDPIHRLMPNIKTSVYISVKDAKASAVEHHGKILHAILQRNADGARQAMEAHLKIAEAHARTLLKKWAEDGKTMQ